jgi:hypothetical protein
MRIPSIPYFLLQPSSVLVAIGIAIVVVILLIALAGPKTSK